MSAQQQKENPTMWIAQQTICTDGVAWIVRDDSNTRQPNYRVADDESQARELAYALNAPDYIEAYEQAALECAEAEAVIDSLEAAA